MPVFINISGQNILFDVDMNYTIQELIASVKNKFTDLQDFYLSYGGEELNMKDTIRNNLIPDGATIDVILRSGGSLTRVDATPTRWTHSTSSTFDVQMKNASKSKLNEEMKDGYYYNSSHKTCPKCKTLCERCNTAQLKIMCQLCRNGYFCWDCGKPWINDFMFCTNSLCGSDETKDIILAQCSSHKIGQVGDVPSIRACPACRCLMELTDNRARIPCWRCGVEFCFICLAVKKANIWPCDEVCRVAPRQQLSFIS